MRTLVALGWWIVTSPHAHAASRLVVQVDRPCVVVVNMKPYPTQGSAVQIDFPDGKEGEQNLRIRNLLGEQQWAGQVDVPAEKKVVATWELRSMTFGPPEPLQDRPGAHDTKRDNLADRGIYVVDGELVHLQPGLDPFEVRELARKGKLKPEPAPTAPVSTEDPFLTAVAEASSTEVAGGGAPTEPAAPTRAPEAGGLGSVQLRNRTGSWANVYVDGAKHEFRGEMEVLLELGTGAHRVEIKDFRDKGTWWAGELWIWPDFTVELHFDQAAPPAALNRAEAWHP